MNVHNALILTDAIIDSLRAVGLSVGDAVGPSTTPAQGYVVVYGLSGGYTDGPISKPNDDAYPIYQLTSLGHTREQCDWIADKARRTILAATLPIGDRVVCRVDIDMLGGVIRDDDVQPPIFYSPDRYRVMTVPMAWA